MPSMARGLDQRGREHRGEAGLDRLGDGHVDQRQLQQRADAGEVVEARAGDLGAALDVDRAEDPAELDVVARLEALGGEVARGADVLEDDEVLLAADRGVGVEQVGQLPEQPLRLGVGLGLLGVGGLHLGGEHGGALEQLRLLLALGLGDQLAQLLLLVAQLVEAGTGRPAALVGTEERVDKADVLSSGALRSAHTVGVLTKQAKVNHRASLPVGRGCVPLHSGAWWSGAGRWRVRRPGGGAGAASDPGLFRLSPG